MLEPRKNKFAHSRPPNRALPAEDETWPLSINHDKAGLKSRDSRRLILGITGCIGCGKSTVARMFNTKDCLLIDADKLAHGLFSIGSCVYERIKKYFGQVIIKDNNCINRGKLAKIVFTNPAALTKLNRIIHPELIRQIKRRIRRTKKKTIILDAALIIEAGLTEMVDKLVVVTAKSQQQIIRSQKNLGLSRKQLVLRIKSQISQKEKLRFADFIIDNSRQISKTQKQVFKIRSTLARLTRKGFLDRR